MGSGPRPLDVCTARAGRERDRACPLRSSPHPPNRPYHVTRAAARRRRGTRREARGSVVGRPPVVYSIHGPRQPAPVMMTPQAVRVYCVRGAPRVPDPLGSVRRSWFLGFCFCLACRPAVPLPRCRSAGRQLRGDIVVGLFPVPRPQTTVPARFLCLSALCLASAPRRAYIPTRQNQNLAIFCHVRTADQVTSAGLRSTATGCAAASTCPLDLEEHVPADPCVVSSQTRSITSHARLQQPR